MLWFRQSLLLAFDHFAVELDGLKGRGWAERRWLREGRL